MSESGEESSHSEQDVPKEMDSATTVVGEVDQPAPRALTSESQPLTSAARESEIQPDSETTERIEVALESVGKEKKKPRNEGKAAKRVSEVTRLEAEAAELKESQRNLKKQAKMGSASEPAKKPRLQASSSLDIPSPPPERKESAVLEDIVSIYTDDQTVENYAKFRPSYSEDVFETILKFLNRESADRNVAVDICCGSQNFRGLIPYFDQIIGVDFSKAQIRYGHQNYPSVDFHLGEAYDLSFRDDASVDLVTCATGYHFLDKDRFLQEVERVLKPNGVLAVYTYWKVFVDKEPMNIFLQERFNDLVDKLKPLKEALAVYDDPWPWEETERHEMELHKSYSISDFMGLMNTLDVLQHIYPERVKCDEFLQNLRDRLLSVYTGEDGTEMPIHATFPLVLVLGRKPK